MLVSSVGLGGKASEDLEYQVEPVVVIDDLLIRCDHESIVKAADHLAEDAEQEALVLHLYEVDPLRLINCPGEHVYQE